jgi:YHS domain-containing protein
MFTRISLVAAVAFSAAAATAVAQQPHALDKTANNAQQAAPHSPSADAQHPQAEAAIQPSGPHGGTIHRAGKLQYETLIEPGGLKLYVYDREGQPLDVRSARGTATLQVEGNSRRYRYDLYPEVQQDQSADALVSAVDLSRVAGQSLTMNFQLVGVPGAERRPATFAASVEAPLSDAQRTAAAIAAQKVCPVTAQPLGSMGDPIPVTIGDQTVYVCCAGCIDAVKANPEKYLSQQLQLNVAQATDADAAAIADQMVCPVMDEPLGSMGTPIKVTGLERDVYLCCKGCVKFLEREPEKYLTKLPAPAEPKPQVTKAGPGDARFVAAQKVCPVMDEPLDAMGGPYRTVVDGRVVYLCCPGCAKKLHANPDAYLDKLANQGVNPPTAR